jgi:hypothetical protein
MPDITKCRGGSCDKKESCYRFTSTPSEYQSYFGKPPLNDDGTCNYYWEIKPIDNDTWDSIYLRWMKSSTRFSVSDLIDYLKSNYSIPKKIKDNGNKKEKEEV